MTRKLKDSEIYLKAAERMMAGNFGYFFCYTHRPSTVLAIEQCINTELPYLTDTAQHKLLAEYFGPHEGSRQSWDKDSAILALLFMHQIALDEERAQTKKAKRRKVSRK